MKQVDKTAQSPTSRGKHGPIPFVLAGISFIPLIGVPLGIICIALAIVVRRDNSKLLGVLGFCGILCTIVIHGVLLPLVNLLFTHGGLNTVFEPHVRSALTTLVRHIEHYKLQNNRYPSDLDVLRSSLKEGEMVITFDVTAPLEWGKKAPDFHYQVVNRGKQYVLFGPGADGKPFTEDDVYPIIDPKKDSAIGWVKRK